MKKSPSMTHGLCYSACGKKPIFGIKSKTVCYCKDELNYDESLTFSSPEGCVSIYRVNNNVVKTHPQDADESKCLTFQTQPENGNTFSKLYKWIACEQVYKLYCYNVSTETHPEENHRWKESAEICFNRSRHSLTYNEMRATNMTFRSPVWTSIICSDVIYEYKEYDRIIGSKTNTKYDGSLPNARFGYVTRTGAVLKFKPDNTQYKALCIDGTRMYPDTSSQSSTTSMYSSSSLAVQVSSNRTSMKLYGEQNVGNEDGDSTVYVIVGASVGTLVAVGILAVTVVVIFRRRRSATPKIPNTEHEVVYSNATFPYIWQRTIVCPNQMLTVLIPRHMVLVRKI
ncbi:uncharacterized protein LOC132758368 isoform X2 [Ruditapes philippinarum]|uniref:uncharacterized protein LOC132758368 isoform X2 n=1 Tax=Ruditapes philippinarum TaxID=129788 RepID=UPI00295C3351|nr:uncharacterized protein LOC132758368 isoform X2 [Ruditapes philippinarum]